MKSLELHSNLKDFSLLPPLHRWEYHYVLTTVLPTLNVKNSANMLWKRECQASPKLNIHKNKLLSLQRVSIKLLLPQIFL